MLGVPAVELEPVYSPFVNYGIYEGLDAKPWTNNTEDPSSQIIVELFRLKPGSRSAASSSAPGRTRYGRVRFSSSCAGPPPNLAHGGAIASAFDAVIGITAGTCGFPGPTLNLTVRYCRPIRLGGSGKEMHSVSWVKEVRQNGTIRLEAEMRDPDDSDMVYASASAIWFCRLVREGAVPTDVGLAPPRPDDLPPPHSTASSETRVGVVAKHEAWAAAKAKAGGWSIAVPTAVPLEAAAAVRSALGLEPLLRSQLPFGLIHDGDDDDVGSRAAAAHFPRAKYASGVEGYVSASPKLAFVSQTGPSSPVSMVVAFSRLACGPPGCVHGGCLFTMLDTAMTQALTVTEENMCLTTSMAVDYQTFTPADAVYLITINPVEANGRRRQLTGQITSPDGQVVHATGTATFVVLAGQPWPRAPSLSKTSSL